MRWRKSGSPCISCGWLGSRFTSLACASSGSCAAVGSRSRRRSSRGYCFVAIELQWHAAHRAPGTNGLVMNGGGPAHVPDNVIAELRSRERNGLIVLPKPRGLRVGSRVKVTIGPFAGQLGIYAGMKPHQRVEVLLTLLGGQQRVSLSREAIEPG